MEVNAPCANEQRLQLRKRERVWLK